MKDWKADLGFEVVKFEPEGQMPVFLIREDGAEDREASLEESVLWNTLMAQQPAASGEVLQLWCETCEGTGKVYIEHQRGCWVGGEQQCPDCEGKGYIESRNFVRAGSTLPAASGEAVADGEWPPLPAPMADYPEAGQAVFDADAVRAYGLACRAAPQPPAAPAPQRERLTDSQMDDAERSAFASTNKTQYTELCKYWYRKGLQDAHSIGTAASAAQKGD